MKPLHPITLLLALGMAVMSGCMFPSTQGELELSSDARGDVHHKLATFYRQEAARMRQASEQMSVRMKVYERLFGPTSDWVAGTRLLLQSYDDAAQEYERKARDHLARSHEAPLQTGAELESR